VSVPFYYALSLESSSPIFLTLGSSFVSSFSLAINCGNSSGLCPLEKHWMTWRQIYIGACRVKWIGHRKVTYVSCSDMETLNGTGCCSMASMTSVDHRVSMISVCRRGSVIFACHRGSTIGVYYKENKTVHDQVNIVNCNGPSEQVSSLGNTSVLVSPYNRNGKKLLSRETNIANCSEKKWRQSYPKIIGD
jgi:hypothetical protein